jgi:hypothetical protein
MPGEASDVMIILDKLIGKDSESDGRDISLENGSTKSKMSPEYCADVVSEVRGIILTLIS